LDAQATAADRVQTGLDAQAADTAKLGAEAAQTAAETARDAILDKAEVNVTTAGNILRADGTEYKAINEAAFLQSKVPFQRSALFAYNDIGQIIHWDNSFGKPNENPRTTTDSGATYTRLSGTGNFSVSSGKFLKTVSADIFSIATGGVGSVEFRTWAMIQPGNRNHVFIVGKDVNNYVTYSIGTINTTINVIIAGVSTNVLSSQTNALFRDGLILASGAAIDMFGDITLTLFQGQTSPPYTRLSLFVHSQKFPFINRTANLDAFVATFSQKADIAFCGWGAAFNVAPISAWTIKSVSP
jgi:hypothetical protein